ncbi:ribonuclease H1 domain-containing protein [Bacillus sp. 1NLA3E]|uniref:ribonuclease H1 domain-containing protein n=1 Tax=Bacillus sp. 1NLA3E TaxID=666686 RepID=UPI000247ED20|nr:ribonuclease H family protein [Bacillus sp. 1NLA3E]AGK54212.1 double-stranded RNA/RNA-DNA hybrid binding protein [Bacillus sp. 1NLA3E]
MADKKKYYVVWAGRNTGVFRSWADCEKQTKGFQGASFKSFPSLEEANQAYSNGKPNYSFSKVKNATKKSGSSEVTVFNPNSISVDAACSGNPGMMEYQGVSTKTGEVLFHFGPTLGTNNIGEFLAIVHALAMLKKQGLDTDIYSDSVTALSWVRNKKANTSLVRNKETETVWNLIERAEAWLKENRYPNKILKWDTNKLGEIKADFGRK